MSDLLAAETQGYLAEDDPPVFIGSVTYGRMVVFTATSTKASDASQLQANVQAESGVWSGTGMVSADQKNYLASLHYDVLAIGGDDTNVAAAITAGDWSGLYAPKRTF